MKRVLVLTVVLSAVAWVHADDDPLANLRTAFDRAQQAVVAGDTAAILAGTYPGLIKQVGGPDAMRDMLSKNLAGLEERGMAVLGTEIVSVSDPVQAGSEIHAVVRATRTVKAPGGRQIQDTFMIAVSADQGKNWTFVDGPQLTPQHIDQLFPDFNDALVLPRVKAPVFERGS